MGTRKRAELAASEKVLQHLTLTQASLQRIEEWLARLAGVRMHLPAAERVPKLLTREEVCRLLGVTLYALMTRIRRGTFPRPRPRHRQARPLAGRGLIEGRCSL